MTPINKPSTLLKKAYKLLSVRERWTKGDYAKTKSGATCEARDKSAACFCALGALRHFKTTDFFGVNGRAEQFLMESLPNRHVLKSGDRYVPDYNDDGKTTHRDILRLYRKAIKQAEREEGKRGF